MPWEFTHRPYQGIAEPKGGGDGQPRPTHPPAHPTAHSRNIFLNRKLKLKFTKGPLEMCG